MCQGMASSNPSPVRWLGELVEKREKPNHYEVWWWAVQASNLRPLQCECSALPLS